MKSTTKRTIGTLFASLISNDRAIEGAKTAPWWIAVVLFLVGNFLPVIPITVNSSKTYGAAYLDSKTYGYEQGLVETFTDLDEQGFSFKIENHQLLAYKNNTLIKDTAIDTSTFPESQPLAFYDRTVKETVDGVTSTYQVRAFNVYYSDSDNITKLVENISSTIYAPKTNTTTDAVNEGNYIPSYVVLSKNYLYSVVANGTSTTGSTYSNANSNWKKTENMDLLEKVLSVKDITKNTRDINYIKGVMSNWKEVNNVAYLEQKTITVWAQTGIFYGVYLALNIFMGLMIFLLTRGKANPNRGLTFIACEGIGAWICFTPAILGMIIGFIMPSNAYLFYILFLGMRTMWLSMKSLNPNY